MEIPVWLYPLEARFLIAEGFVYILRSSQVEADRKRHLRWLLGQREGRVSSVGEASEEFLNRFVKFSGYPSVGAWEAGSRGGLIYRIDSIEQN